MVKIIHFSSDGEFVQDINHQELMTTLQNKTGFVWVEMDAPTLDETEIILQGTFQFHPLAIEDCQSTGYQAPKVDDFDKYLFMIMHAIMPSPDLKDLETGELNIFLGKNYIVTYHMNPTMPPIDEVWSKIGRDSRLRTNGSDFICHAVLDHLVDDYMPLLDKMDEELEWLEDMVLEKPSPKTLERILTLKHSVMSLRRIINPQREVINKLSRDDYTQIDKASRIYFRDIYDHLVRIQDLTESIRDIVSSAMDIYLNSTSLRLNEIMKALTIVSTIFLPLSFFAGVYGMNFKHMPEINWLLGYPLAWLIFILIATGMILFFKKRKWF